MNLQHLYTSGRIIDFLLGFVALEFIVLSIAYWRTSRGIAPKDLLTNLLAGAFLLLALRSTLDGHSWSWRAAFLGASFPAHLLDLRRRWNNHGRSRRPGDETGIAPGRRDR